MRNNIELKLKQRILSEYKSLRAFTTEAGVPYSTVDTMLKKGIGGTGFATVVKICAALKISVAALSRGEIDGRTERGRYGAYERLNAEGRGKADDYIKDLSMIDKYTWTGKTEKSELPSPKIKYKVKYYDAPVSAGLGEYIDSEQYKTLETNVKPPIGTDFAVRVLGDSMEPTFSDADIIFVRSQEAVGFGEIGIFSINGDVYVKEFVRGGLKSHNAKYPEIMFNEYDELRCFGKVLGRMKTEPEM